MIKIPFEDIITKIEENSDLTSDAIDSKIKQKMDQLSGLISKEGAAHIIANELGIKIFETVSGKVQIKNVLTGMRNVETVGKVQQIFDVREFATGNRQGKVGSLVIADETDNIRVVLWNNQAENIQNLKENDIVKIVGGYVRENRGRKEIHLNDQSKVIINPEGEKIDKVKEVVTNRKNIKNLEENDQDIDIVGTIVQVFDARFYEICPECGRRARQKEDKFACETHGNVTPDYSYVMNMFVDDGTDNIRVVCFRNQADRLTKKTHEEMLQYRESPDKFEDIKLALMGNLVKFRGRVTKNEMFDRLEFISNMVFTDLDPDEEIKRLNEEAEKEEKKEILVGAEEEKTKPVEKEVTEEKKEIEETKEPEEIKKEENEITEETSEEPKEEKEEESKIIEEKKEEKEETETEEEKTETDSDIIIEEETESDAEEEIDEETKEEKLPSVEEL